MEPAAANPTPDPAPARGPPHPAQQDTPKRRFRNYLLDAGLQLRLASYLLAVATALSVGLGWLLWSAYRETSRVVALADAEAGSSIAAALAEEDRGRIVLVAVALALILSCLLVAAVVVTHRIAGPAFAIRGICRQIADGVLPRPRPVRTRDQLVDLARTVAEMVDALRQREERERQAMLQAAAALRSRAASREACAGVASELERIAAEKEARLRS